MTSGSVIRDQNRVPVWWGLSSVDGKTLVPISINSSTGKPMFEIGTSISAVISNIPETIPRDENRIPCLTGVSNTDSSVRIPVSVNPTTGAILAILP